MLLNILRAMKLQLSRCLQESSSLFLTSGSWKGNERSHVPSAQGRVLQDSLFGCGGWGFSRRPAAAGTLQVWQLSLSLLPWTSGPQGKVARPLQSGNGGQFLVWKWLVKGWGTSFYSLCFNVGMLPLAWRESGAFPLGLGPEKSQQLPVPLETWHHLSQGAAGSHTPYNCLRRNRRGEGTFFYLADWFQVYSGW